MVLFLSGIDHEVQPEPAKPAGDHNFNAFIGTQFMRLNTLNLDDMLSGGEDDDFTDYQMALGEIELERLQRKIKMNQKKTTEAWDDKKAKQHAESLYKYTSAQLWSEMRIQTREKVNECKAEKSEAIKELKMCTTKKAEINTGVLDFTNLASAGVLTRDDVLESVCEYENEMKAKLKGLDTPWKIKLGLNDELRQLKAKARKDLGLRRPILSCALDFIIHKVNKMVNGRRYNSYKVV